MKQQNPSLFPSAEDLWTTQFQECVHASVPVFPAQKRGSEHKCICKDCSRPSNGKMAGNWLRKQARVRPTPRQYFLDRAVWDAEKLRDVVRAYVRETIGDQNAVLVIDETGFLKKGTKSVGVQRQYSGTAGRIENSHIGVFLTDTSQGGHTLIDRELYLPKSWTQAPERGQEADVPEEVVCTTKPELAARMLWRTLDAGVPAAWVVGDTVYGSHRPLRTGLEDRQQAYALAIPCKEQVEVQDQRQRVDQVAK